MKKILFILIAICMIACNNSKSTDNKNANKEIAQTENDSLQNTVKEVKSDVKKQITTFLTFQNNDAEEAMNFYVSLFDNSEIIDIQRYGKEVPAPEGAILIASFSLNGKEFYCSDSYIKHEWDFSPSVSMFVDCKDENELQRLFTKLSEKGQVMMPLDNYGWSQKFGFVADQFGVSWQLNLQ